MLNLRFHKMLCLAVVLAAFPSFALAQANKKPAAKPKPIEIAKVERTGLVDFEKEVLPLLERSCTACHNVAYAENNLVLEDPPAILKGGKRGPAAVAGKGAESLMLLVAAHTKEPVMPPADNDVEAPNLKPEELGLIKLWIDQGATGTVTKKGSAPVAWQPLPLGVNPIYAVALSPDGQYAACGRANQVFIYHVPTQQLITRLTDPRAVSVLGGKRPGVAHLDIVQSLAFNPAGDLLASSGFREVKLWRRPANVERQRFDTPAEVQTLAVSADGKWLATGEANNTIALWNLAEGKAGPVLSGHTGAVTALQFAPDGSKLYSASQDRSLRVWNTADGALAGRLDTPTPLLSLALVNKATQLATGGEENLIRIWNLPAAVVAAANVPQNIAKLSASPDRKWLALAQADGKIAIYELASQKVVRTLAGHAGGVTSLTFNSANKLVSTGADKQAFVWDPAADQPTATLPAGEANLTAVALSPNGEVLAVGNDKGQVSVSKPDGADAKQVVDHGKRISSLAFSNDGQTLFTAGEDGTVRGIQVANAQQKFSANHGAPVHDLAVSADNKWLASAGENKQVRIWNSANGSNAPKPQWDGFSGPVKSVTFSGDNNHLVAAAGPEVLVFHLTEGVVEQAFAQHAAAVAGLAVTGDKGQFIVSADDKNVRLWELHAANRIAGHTGPVRSLAAVGDAQLLSGSQDGQVKQWTVSNGQAVRSMNHGGPVTSVAVRADGQRFASSSENNTIKLWNAPNGQQVVEMRGDLYAQRVVAGLERDLTKIKAKHKSGTDALAAAEKDLPTKADAQKKAREAKEAAEKTFKEKSDAVAKLLKEKMDQDKLVADTSAALQKAQADQKTADDLNKKAAEAVKPAEQQAAQAKQAADKDKENKDLAKAAEDAQKALEAAQAAAKAATEAKQAADKLVADSDKAAKEAADKAKAQEKPLADAEKAKADTEAAFKKSDRDLADADSALKKVQDSIPEAKKVIADADTEQKRLEAALEAGKKQVAENEKPIRSVQFSSDNRLLLSGGDNGALYTWDATTGTPVESYRGHQGPVKAVAFGPDRSIISGSADKRAVVWELAPQWTLERTIGAFDDSAKFVDRVLAVDFSPNGAMLATGGGEPSRSGELKIWNVADGSLVREVVDAHSDTVFSVRFSPDGKQIASSGADKFVKVFTVDNGQLVRPYEGHTHHVLGVSWQADMQSLASSGADNVVKIWNTETGEQRRTVQGFGKQVTAIQFLGETNTVICCSGDKIVRSLRIDNGGTVRSFGGPTDFMYCVSSTPDARLVAAGGHDSVLRIWDANTGTTVVNFDPPPAPSTDVVAENPGK